MSSRSAVVDSAQLNENVNTNANGSSSSTKTIKALVQSAQHHKRRARSRAFATQLRFSWLQFLAGLFSLVLVCTDIPRSGLGINSYLAQTTALEPDVFQFYGPWAYSMQSAAAASANVTDARVWGYKFDTTSITLRAFAKWYGLTTFPPCVLYTMACPTDALPGATVFAMMDSLVDAAAATVPRGVATIHNRAEPMRLTLRSENTYLDRLHHYLFPSVFATPIRRTNQLLYYAPALLANTTSSAHAASENARRVCFGFASRPLFCQALWTNFALACGRAGGSDCTRVGRVADHTMQRVRAVQQQYPSLPIDVTIIESFDDAQSCRCGVCLSGVRKADVTVITRVRQCNSDSYSNGSSAASSTASSLCRTVFLDEFRYETGVVHTHAMQWFHVVAALRVVGQSYYYVRIAMLFAFCFALVSDDVDDSSCDDDDDRMAGQRDANTDSDAPRPTLYTRVRLAGALFFKTPMQTLIFGAPLPLACYVCAHAIDANVTYELLANIFTTQNGVFQTSARDLCFVGFNQMRSVWVFAIALHMSIGVRSFSRRGLSWHPIDGVRGAPEFFLGAMASLTMGAQLRSIRFRNTAVRSVFAVTDSPTLLAIKHQHGTAYRRGTGVVPLSGMLIDIKYLLAIVLVCGAALTLRNARSRLRATDRTPKLLRHTKSPVSYAAGVLWPVTAMCVHWPDDYYCVKPPPPTLLPPVPAACSAPPTATVGPAATFEGQRRSLCAPPGRVHPWGIATALKSLPSVVMTRRWYHVLQAQMTVLHERDDNVDASIAFMNLVMLSDPVVYYVLRNGGRTNDGRRLGYYRSRRTPTKVFLLPCDVVVASDAHMCDLELLLCTQSSALRFVDLVHCG